MNESSRAFRRAHAQQMCFLAGAFLLAHGYVSKSTWLVSDWVGELALCLSFGTKDTECRGGVS